MSDDKSICPLCDRPVYKRGYCRRHYHRLMKYGDPLVGKTLHGEPRAFIDRLLEEKPVGCVIWPFAVSGNGYGVTWWDGRMTTVSRLLCRLVHGDPPDEAMQAAHSCGNGARGCVNPKCLYWATRAENEADKIIHGTLQVGEKNGAAKLTDLQAEAIRRDTRLQKLIAAEYGVSRPLVSRIKAGKCRSTVTRPV